MELPLFNFESENFKQMTPEEKEKEMIRHLQELQRNVEGCIEEVTKMNQKLKH